MSTKELVTEFTSSLAVRDGQPELACMSLAHLTNALIGAKLFTLMTCDRQHRVVRRIYSNQPAAYPIQGTKPIQNNAWTTQVLEQGEEFVANDIAGIAAVFDDHELINSLGCAAVLNIPVIVAGEVLGTINCLDQAGHYDTDRIKAAHALRLPGAACFLLARALAKQEKINA